MKLINLFIGLLFIIRDVFFGLIVFIRDMLFISFQNNKQRKNNEFLALLGKENYFIDIILIGGPILLVMHFTLLGAVFFMVIWVFILNNLKERYESTGESYIFSSISTVILLVIFSIYSLNTTSDNFKEIAEIELHQNDIFYGEDNNKTRYKIEIEVNNKLVDLVVEGCKPGKHIVIEKHFQTTMINFLPKSYAAKCSSYLQLPKQLVGVNKIEGIEK